MLYEPDERKTTIEQQRNIISGFSDSESKTMLVAIDSGSDEIAGFTVGIGNELSRNKHTVYCVIGVLQKFTGKGFGKTLLKSLELWAKENGIHRIELTVMEHNTRAISLYKSFGFEVEGVKRKSLKVNGDYVNELYMSKLIYA
ncbi:GNAT family N-acetyltransferase [Endozoicomonas sp. 4G]|uniref:GNAT family N-acetyltransferase n=1 Tax=Endozoicomonas sp. 4G TaxID=2872754 RepID=UPI002078F1C6|nr:GNAT family N-acetyltransferase [Endozoicomonas sp. 4G]